jgi:hypothetical protein
MKIILKQLNVFYFQKIGIIFVLLFFVFNFVYPQIVNATLYAPGTTLEPDCPPTESLSTCGVIVTNLGTTNLTLTGARTLTLDGYALTLDGALDIVFNNNGNTTIGGDLTISGDDLFLGTNTLGAILVADGMNFNPVVLSGDASINAGGALTINYNAAQSASAVNKGFLTSADWTTFNSKQTALGFTAEDLANKSTDTALGTSDTLYPTQKAVKTYADNLSLGLTWHNPVEIINVIADTDTPAPAVDLDVYIINTGGNTGAWSSFSPGDMIQYQTDEWVLIKAMAIGDRFGVSFKSSTIASGSMTGKDNYLVQITGGTSGAFTYTFEAPQNNDATFVQNVNAYYHNVTFTYSTHLNAWVQLSAAIDFTHGNGLDTNGTIISLGTLTSNWNQTGAFDITTAGDINLNGGDLKTSASTANLFNTNATILNIGGVATTINLGASGATVTGGGILTIDSGTTSALNFGTGSNAKTITIGNTTGTTALNLQSGTGNIGLQVASTGTTGNVQIGVGGAGSATPDLMVLDIKSTSGDPTGTAGAIYYNSNTGKFRCYENNAWANCITPPGSDLQHVTSYDTSQVLTNIGSSQVILGSVSITPLSATGDIYVTGQTDVISSNATDQTFVLTIETGATCSGSTVGNATNSYTITAAPSNDVGTVIVSGIAVDPGASSQAYSLCASTATGDTDVMNWRLEATVIDTGADLAEIYTTNDESIEAGDVVSLDPNLKTGIKKSVGVNDQNVLGIVSTKPGMVIGGVNDEGVNALPVALSGRVPVKVITENGIISSGDYLIPSSMPGVAMKSNGSGSVIGQAISDYDGEGIGVVLVFVKNFDLGSNSLVLGDISKIDGLATLITTIQSEIIRDPIAIITAKILEGKQFLTDFITTRLTAIRGYFDEIFTKKFHTEEFCIKKSDGNEVCVNGDQVDTLLNNANISPIVSTPPITLDSSTALDSILSKPEPSAELLVNPVLDLTPVLDSAPMLDPTPISDVVTPPIEVFVPEPVLSTPTEQSEEIINQPNQ